MPTIKLPRLFAGWRDQPELFERYFDEAMTSIETSLNAVLQIPLIEEALADLDAATAAATAAAANANAAANGVTSETSLVNSYVDNFTAPLISAASDGTVTVAAHDRVYGDQTMNPTVAVDGDSFATTALADEVVRVFYEDALREGGAVIYQYTIDPAPPPVQGGVVHSVGTVVIPLAGTEDGNYIKPPGYVDKFL